MQASCGARSQPNRLRGLYLTDVVAIPITKIHPTMTSATIAPRVILAFSLNEYGLPVFTRSLEPGSVEILSLFRVSGRQSFL